MKLLRVIAPHFVAGAIWERDMIGWRCTRAAPILKWMIGKTPEFVADYLKHKGWKHEWI